MVCGMLIFAQTDANIISPGNRAMGHASMTSSHFLPATFLPRQLEIHIFLYYHRQCLLPIKQAHWHCHAPYLRSKWLAVRHASCLPVLMTLLLPPTWRACCLVLVLCLWHPSS